MGMYHWVAFSAPVYCPKCGQGLGDFQSKDTSQVSPLACQFVPITAVNNLYTSCRYCDSWIEFYRRADRNTGTLSDFCIGWDERAIQYPMNEDAPRLLPPDLPE